MHGKTEGATEYHHGAIVALWYYSWKYILFDKSACEPYMVQLSY